MTKENSHKNNNRSQTMENGYGRNKGRIVSMGVIAGIGLTLMLVSSSSMLVHEALAKVRCPQIAPDCDIIIGQGYPEPLDVDRVVQQAMDEWPSAPSFDQQP